MFGMKGEQTKVIHVVNVKIDDIGWDILKEEASKYYANIVMPYGDQVLKALEVLSDLDIDMIAPSHGVIWRSFIPQILHEYSKWASYKSDDKALIVYDSMWGSTETIARALYEGVNESGMPVRIRNLKTCHISDVITDVLSSRLIMIGSPTLNNGLLPTVGGFLTYLKGLRPRKRTGFAFGSYGWGGQAVGEIEQVMKDLSWDIPQQGIKIQYIPDEHELNEVKKTGKNLVKYLKKEKIAEKKEV